MRPSTGLSTQLGQKTTLTKLQFQYAKLLEKNAEEFEDAVMREIDANPALEVKTDQTGSVDTTIDGAEFKETPEEMQIKDFPEDDVPSYFQNRRNGSDNSRDSYFTPADNSETLYDHLENQLGEQNLSEDEYIAAQYIIGNLDPKGYLERELLEISDDIAFSESKIIDMPVMQKALKTVQSLDPDGVGARNLQECLLIQLRKISPSQKRDDAIDIIEKCFDTFRKKHYFKLPSELHISKQRSDVAVELIVSLNPKPGALYGNELTDNSRPIIPDFEITIDDGKITISLNNRIPELQIAESFESAIKSMERNASNRKSKDSEYIKRNYDDANDYIILIQQRQKTLMSVMTAIVEIQHKYFLSDDIHDLRPMILKDISERTGYDISTISRATNQKYVQTPSGIRPLRFFFGDAIGEEGRKFTSKIIEHYIREFIDNEDKRHPLSDERLRELIAAKGYDVSRRTIAKYRSGLNISECRLRKEA